MSLSGWCQSAPGARPDQHHKFCRSVTCTCAAHVAESPVEQGISAETRYHKGTNKDGPNGCANTKRPALADCKESTNERS